MAERSAESPKTSGVRDELHGSVPRGEQNLKQGEADLVLPRWSKWARRGLRGFMYLSFGLELKLYHYMETHQLEKIDNQQTKLHQRQK